MYTFIRGFLAVVGLIVVVLVVVGVVVALVAREQLPERTVLVIDFEQPILESVPDEPLGALLLGERLIVRNVVDAIDRAAQDERVLGVIARVGGGEQGIGAIEEFRQAIHRFRASGKPALVYAETMGELAPGNAGYYLATAFDEIYLQESGDIGLTGLIDENVFVAGTLERLGLEPRLDHRHEYKNAMNVITERELTDAHREVNTALLESIFGTMVESMADARGLPPERVRALIDQGPFLAREAVEMGLIDGLAYRSEVHARMRQHLDDTAFETVGPARYLALAGRPHDSGPRVALIIGSGTILRGESTFDPLFGASTMGSDTLARAFRAAIEDDDIDAILFRIDSPGGSFVASDAVWRMVVEAREAGKPVVASMGNVAASGGYYVAMAADRIVAQPSTLTGSIGVLGGKVIAREPLEEHLGLTFDNLQTSANATMYSMLHDYTEYGWQRHQDWLDRVYQEFVTKAADGRGMEFETLEGLARGRVWTGTQALERGLIDALGGYGEAHAELRALLEIEPDAPIEVVPFPAPQPLWQRLLEREERPLTAPPAWLAELRSTAQQLRRAGVLGNRGALEAPHLPDIR